MLLALSSLPDTPFLRKISSKPLKPKPKHHIENKLVTVFSSKITFFMLNVEAPTIQQFLGRSCSLACLKTSRKNKMSGQ